MPFALHPVTVPCCLHLTCPDPALHTRLGLLLLPFLQEGGLGDVVTALGRAVQEEGHEVEVVLPKYDCINYNLVQASGVSAWKRLLLAHTLEEVERVLPSTPASIT